MTDERKSETRGSADETRERGRGASRRARDGRWILLVLLGALLMLPGRAHALTIRRVQVVFGGSGADQITIIGTIDGIPQPIEQFPSVRVDIGPYSETIPTALFEERHNVDGTPRHYYRYFMPRERKRARSPGITQMYLDYAFGRFMIKAKDIPLKRATNPMPFRLVGGLGDQCVMLQFQESAAIRPIFDFDPVTGELLSVQHVNDGGHHARWTFLPDATQPSCGIKDFAAKPKGFTVNRHTPVRFEARVPGATNPHLQVFSVDASLETISDPLCDLHDDGADGDDVRSDHVYSCRIDFFEETPQIIRLVARGVVNGVDAISPKVELDVVPELIEDDASVFIENMYRARDLWGENLANLGNTQAAREATAAAIKGLAFVRDVAFDDSVFLIEFAVDDYPGILAYLPAVGSESRRAPIPPGTASALSTLPPNFSPTSFSMYENVNTLLSAQASQQAEDTSIKNTRILVWAPFYGRSFPNDELNDLRHRFATNECPSFDVNLVRDEDCTLDSVRHFSDYGTLILATDGFKPPSQLRLDRDQIVDDQPLFATGERLQPARVTAEIVNLYIRDRMASFGVPGVPERRTPRTVFYWSDDRGPVWAIRPEFLEELPRRFPESVVYAGWNYSAFNFKMAQAFVGGGARTFFGFDGPVNASFTRDSIQEIFGRMLDGSSAVNAYAGLSAYVDPQSGARLRIAGDGRSTFQEITGVLNGDFESGTLTSWNAEGDGRVVSQLANVHPRNGAFMGLLSTGLGEYFDSGSIEQAACVGSGAHRVTFDWNLLSEEFRNWCYQGFSDFFEVYVNGTRVFHRDIDGLCATNSFVPDLTFDSNDDVFATGWRTDSIDVSPFLGNKTIALKFLVSDVQDSGRDTAVLLDHIHFE